ncbi:conserved hypothetical protein [Burkholderia pseudomallei 305]|nr:conserved hypothetical protein [Burkholderia pseudomallei 305]EEC38489.1 hypothetical protein BUC_5190 [Burkholderia pseudomallei 576]
MFAFLDEADFVHNQYRVARTQLLNHVMTQDAVCRIRISPRTLE